MKKTALLGATIALLMTASFAAGHVAQANQYGNTMNASREAQVADKELNAVYGQLVKKLDKPAKAKLLTAQLAWLKFRDAQAAFEADWYRGGSLSRQQEFDSLTRTTRARTREFRDALDMKNSM